MRLSRCSVGQWKETLARPGGLNEKKWMQRTRRLGQINPWKRSYILGPYLLYDVSIAPAAGASAIFPFSPELLSLYGSVNEGNGLGIDPFAGLWGKSWLVFWNCDYMLAGDVGVMLIERFCGWSGRLQQVQWGGSEFVNLYRQRKLWRCSKEMWFWISFNGYSERSVFENKFY